MEEYVIRSGKRLRLGYTTGSCAAAAAKAAAWMLLTGRERREITLTVPRGVTLTLDIRDVSRGEDFVSCAVETGVWSGRAMALLKPNLLIPRATDLGLYLRHCHCPCPCMQH